MSQYAILDSLATELRITGRILQETWGGLRRSGWMNIVIIVTMAAILSIFGTLSAFLLETQLFVDKFGSSLQISVYLDKRADLDSVTNKIETIPTVSAVQVIPRDKAWDEMRAEYQVPDIANPLPDTLHVKMRDFRFIEDAGNQIKAMDGVEKIQFPHEVLKKVQDIAKITSLVGLAVTIFLGMMTLFIISNTIHLLIQSRSREIEILRMMGVGNWYIRLPFLFQGAVYGLVGALLAYGPLAISEHYIANMFDWFGFLPSGYSQSFIFTIMVVMGIGVGAIGAGISTHRYLKV
jgi:cell division transport system permease protein